ncbi:MAG: DNA damage-inducible protein D [Christensenellaceae bacterium]|jgi:DNA-damage-inducible protein D|nr:DNA damage-inducible protein D [Christensenellaceae bacterium]
MEKLNTNEYKSFEEIKHIGEDGSEFWFARELAPVLGYNKWENFSKVIDKAMLACKNSGQDVYYQFPDVRKLITHAKGGKRTIQDYKLSRYACYLIVQNGDPRKQIIAIAQTYFAVQTRRAELFEQMAQLDEDNKRLVVRNDIKQWNQILAETAYKAGAITDEEYAEFQNSGYIGLYGGEKVEDIHKRKGLEPKQRILDYMNSSELIANLFRISQADEKIKNENIKGTKNINKAHNEVGQNVREAIKKNKGILPENQPTPEKSVEEITKEQLKELHKHRKHLMLDEDI